MTNPIIYIFAHKQHMYFTEDYDRKNSLYPEWACNDNVDGKGARVLADVKSLLRFNLQIPHNNVGEPKFHPSPPFFNDLSHYYPGHSAWSEKKFYDCDPVRSKWLSK